eukprot:1292810-Prymnesium_polylepis.1
MSNMFAYTTAFNKDFSGWKTLNVKDMSYMFAHTRGFNVDIVDIGRWDTSKVIDMQAMFNDTLFNMEISGWDRPTASRAQRVPHAPR